MKNIAVYFAKNMLPSFELNGKPTFSNVGQNQSVINQG